VCFFLFFFDEKIFNISIDDGWEGH